MKSLIIFVAFLALCSPNEEIHSDSDFIRIINGEYALAGEAPWQVLLRVISPRGYHISCGGALLSSEWVVTSADCVYRSHDVQAILGVSRAYGPESGRVQLAAPYIIWHPLYNPATLRQRNNIALVRLIRPVNFSVRIRPITVATAWLLNNSTVTVTGWGSLSATSGAMSMFLKKATMRSIPSELCGSGNDIICARGGNALLSVGDSGSPLTSVTASGVHLQGIGFYANHTTNVNAFTRVSMYRSFIRGITGLIIP